MVAVLKLLMLSMELGTLLLLIMNHGSGHRLVTSINQSMRSLCYGRSNSTNEFSITFVNAKDTSCNFHFCTTIQSQSSTLFNYFVNPDKSFLWFIFRGNFHCASHNEIRFRLIRRN